MFQAKDSLMFYLVISFDCLIVGHVSFDCWEIVRKEIKGN